MIVDVDVVVDVGNSNGLVLVMVGVGVSVVGDSDVEHVGLAEHAHLVEMAGQVRQLVSLLARCSVHDVCTWSATAVPVKRLLLSASDTKRVRRVSSGGMVPTIRFDDKFSSVSIVNEPSSDASDPSSSAPEIEIRVTELPQQPSHVADKSGHVLEPMNCGHMVDELQPSAANTRRNAVICDCASCATTMPLNKIKLKSELIAINELD
jgi:hypothetical protein